MSTESSDSPSLANLLPPIATESPTLDDQGSYSESKDLKKLRDADRSDKLWGTLAAIFFAGLLFLATIGTLTLLHVDSAISSHSQTLAQIHAVVERLQVFDKDQKKGNATVSRIFVEAGQEVKTLNQKLAVLCVELNAKC